MHPRSAREQNWNGRMELFYDAIAGFEYEPGFIYKLLVSKKDIDNPLIDASSVRYKLIEVYRKILSCSQFKYYI
jgi:hypothetical protein